MSFEVVAQGPAARLAAWFTFDPPTGVLTFDLDVSGTPRNEVHAVDLHRSGAGADGPVIHRLAGPGVVPASGQITLTGPEIEAFRDGTIFTWVCIHGSTPPERLVSRCSSRPAEVQSR